MLLDQGPVVLGADNVIQGINRYPVHTNTAYPMDCDLSTGPDLEFQTRSLESIPKMVKIYTLFQPKTKRHKTLHIPVA